jgi:hypothetical protein
MYLSRETILVQAGRGTSWPMPKTITLHLLRELRDDIKALDNKLDLKLGTLDKKIDRNHEEVKKRLDGIQRAITGESILGRYATAEFEERIAAIEHRLSVLEEGR